MKNWILACFILEDLIKEGWYIWGETTNIETKRPGIGLMNDDHPSAQITIREDIINVVYGNPQQKVDFPIDRQASIEILKIFALVECPKCNSEGDLCI